ncbi:MAG: hypothetical protein FWG25_06515 [Promicromonosporaceae bacterium]|nr:hypothetical protein [Promicromonosporaceae bacterium]
MVARSKALINLDELSPATRKELEVWGEHLAHAGEAEVFSPKRPNNPAVIGELQRTAALKAYLMAEADKAIKEAVYRARAEKLSWHSIGNALGITGEAARLRYADR